MARIAVGIPTFNGAMRVESILKAISLRTPLLQAGDVEVVVVDDGSDKESESRAVATRWGDTMPLRYVAHGNNLGVSAAWNTISRATDAPIVVIANDDVIVSSGGWLESLVHVLEHCPGVGVVGHSAHAFTLDDVSALLAGPDADMTVIPRDPVTKNRAPERRGYEDAPNPARVMAPAGMLFAFRRADFEAVGGFDEVYTSGYEEACFGTSMAARGLIGLQLTWPFVWHMWSATFIANPQIDAGERLGKGRVHYRKKWDVPAGVHEFEYTNPKFLGAIGPVEVSFLRKNSVVAHGVLAQDGSFKVIEVP